jgi:hypothetical protein
MACFEVAPEQAMKPDIRFGTVIAAHRRFLDVRYVGLPRMRESGNTPPLQDPDTSTQRALGGRLRGGPTYRDDIQFARLSPTLKCEADERYLQTRS